MICSKTVSACALAALAAIFNPALAEETLNLMNWSEYIAPNTIKNFEKETGITVHTTLIDSNEMLEAKLMAGSGGYDVIVPSIHVLKRLSDAGLLQKLDKQKLPNLKHMDPGKMAKAATVDHDNAYGIPYMELSTGIGYNVDKVAKVMGPDFKLDSWDAIFKPEIASKLKQCGLTVLDSPSDMICSTLLFLHRNPASTDPDDYAVAQSLLSSAMPNITYISNDRYRSDLASGEVCVSVGWSGDIGSAGESSAAAGLGKIAYIIPKEGALMGYDMLAIPKNSQHKDNAYKFINYLMRPEVIAEISNYLRYANPNKDATPLVDKAMTSNPGIYYSNEVLKRMHIVVPPDPKILTKVWNNVRMSATD